jgi:hypothetical protein
LVAVLPAATVAAAESRPDPDEPSPGAPDWVRIYDGEGRKLGPTDYAVSQADSESGIAIRSLGPLQGDFTVLVEKGALQSIVPDPALAGMKFESVVLEGEDWYSVRLQLTGAPLDLKFSNFEPKLAVPQYTLGSNRSILLQRPMFISLVERPHFENRTMTGKNANGTFAYEVEHFVLELGIEFDDTDTSGQSVQIYSGWLTSLGFTRPYFVHEDGAPVSNRSLGSHWLLEPDHFSAIWVFSVDEEGFSKENNYYYSHVDWDDYNRRIVVLSDRRDPNWANEMFKVATTFVWDRTTSFTIRAAWATTLRGDWQEAIPLFFTAASNSNLNSPNTIRVRYVSLGYPLQTNPVYYLEYISSSGTLYSIAGATAPPNAQYFFAFEYDTYDGVLKLSMFDEDGVQITSGSLDISASNAFALGKIGAASKGRGMSYETPTIGWTDSIFVDRNFAKNGDMELDDDANGIPDSWVAEVPGSSQNFVFDFDSSDEGFAKETNYPYSDVRWDSANGRVYVKSNRRDAGDEMFTRSTGTIDTSTDFTVTARWRATQQGNWQGAWPVFLAGQSNTEVKAANSVYIYYYSLDSNLHQNPRYYMQYRDGTNTIRLNVYYTAQANTEYHLFIDYDASSQVLLLEVRNVNDVTLASASYTIGTNPNDGFTFGKIGVSSDGWSGSSEPVIIAWSDDITLSIGSSSSSISRSSARSYVNTYSVRMEDASSGEYLNLESASDARAEGGPGAYFRASAWVYAETGSYRLYLQFYDSSGYLINEHFTSTTTNWQWEFLELITMAPDNVASTGITLHSTSANVGVAYWDAVELEAMREFWSLNHHDGDIGGGLGGWKQAFDYALDLGVSHVRTDLRWFWFQTSYNADWNQGTVDYWRSIIQAGKVRGIDLIVILNGEEPSGIPPGVLYAEYSQFCEKIAYEYGEDIFYYQILNEHNIIQEIPGDLPTFASNCFSGLLLGEGVTGPNHRSAFKTIVNVAAEVPFWNLLFLRPWLDEAGPAIDVPAIDWYPGTKWPSNCADWGALDTLFGIMEDYSKEGAIMETGYSSYRMPLLDEIAQEAWVNCALLIIRDKARTHVISHPTIPLLLGNWYELADHNSNSWLPPPWTILTMLDHFGLIRSDNYAPKLAYDDFRARVAGFEF